MTLKELYDEIGGDYDLAIKVLRIEKLMDKHIRKLPQSDIFADIAEAGKSMDAVLLFESAHALKGFCSNLGLTGMADISEEICTEFRPGRERKLTDDDVRKKISMLSAMYEKVCDGIQKYEQTDL